MPKPLVQSTGRRKASVARVRFFDGSGQVVLNGRPLEDFFPTMAARMRVLEPLNLTQTQGRYDINAPTLKKAGMLTRDSRIVESKKYGLKKARKAPQYTKR